MKRHKELPIGMFDSGVGGISIFNEINQLLPCEDVIYLADSKNAPYGNRGHDAIINLSIKNTELLLAHNCKLIVIPCNTATTNAIDYLRAHYSVPFVGIEPAVKPAALESKTKSIGILATKGTLSSRLFQKTSILFAKNIEVIEVIGNGLVERIEEGKIDTKETQLLVKKLLAPLIEKRIDYLVLGCSHYPFLRPIIKKHLHNDVKVIDSGQPVAQQVQRVLNEKNLLNPQEEDPRLQFYSNIKKTGVLKSFIKTSGDFKIQYKNF